MSILRTQAPGIEPSPSAAGAILALLVADRVIQFSQSILEYLKWFKA